MLQPSLDASSWSVFLGRLSVHQDYAWFVALLCWSLALVAWRWHPDRRTAWAWLPWSAVAGVLAAAVQFGIYSPPFDFFHDRLIPGTFSGYTTAIISVDLLGDLLLGWLTAALAAAWWLARPAPGRGAAVAAIFAGAMLYPIAPLWGSSLLAGATLAAVFAWWPVATGAARLALLAAAVLPFGSTVGPIAAALGRLQGSGPPTPMGLGAALLQIVAGAAALGGLLRGALQSAGLESLTMLVRQARAWFLAAALWLALGLGFAWQTGRDNRFELLQNRLRGTAARALLFDTAALEQLAAQNYGLARREFVEAGLLRSPLPDEPAADALHRQMHQEHNATVYTDRARLIVVHDGWLLAIASSSPRQPPGTIEFIRRATPQDLADWDGRRNLIESSPVAEVGQPYYTRAALVDHRGRMLGWLEFSREEFFQSLARKWHTGPLLVTALGLVLAAQGYLQRRVAREREAALRAAAVAAEASRLKTAFLAKVSHELRTPLQSILGYGQLLEPRLGDDARAREWLGALQRHGEIMTRLVNDLLDLSAAESSAFPLAPVRLAPGPLVAQLAESLAPRAAAKGIGLRCTMAATVPAWVEADGNRLGQIVLNLAGNAVKFTTAGEVVVTLDAHIQPHGRIRLELAVRDTGPGVAPADQARLFEPFARLEPTSAHEGSGLGLAVSRALCRAMEGDLTVESDGRSGSCFRATVVVNAARDEPAASAAPTPPPHLPTVLIVEDNALVRELFVSFLAGQGCACATATGGDEALARLDAGAPDAIVLDLSLPDGDGVALVPRLRARAPAARIVAVSAHANETDRARALAAGAQAFFSKPVALDQLWAAVLGGATSAAPPMGVTPATLWPAFLAELSRLEEEIAAGLAAGDLVRVRRRAHYLANSAVAVEARELLDACLAVERAAERGEAAAAARAWARCGPILTGLRRRAA